MAYFESYADTKIQLSTVAPYVGLVALAFMNNQHIAGSKTFSSIGLQFHQSWSTVQSAIQTLQGQGQKVLADPMQLWPSLRAGTTFPSHLQIPPHLPVSNSHLASCRSHLPHPPASGRQPDVRAVCICHLVHIIYAIQAHLDLRRASRPSHLPSCHLEMEMEIWVFTSSPGRASTQAGCTHIGFQSNATPFTLKMHHQIHQAIRHLPQKALRLVQACMHVQTELHAAVTATTGNVLSHWQTLARHEYHLDAYKQTTRLSWS